MHEFGERERSADAMTTVFGNRKGQMRGKNIDY